MTENNHIKNLNELSGLQLELSEIATQLFRALNATFYAHIRGMPDETINKLENHGFVNVIYNALAMLTFDICANTNHANDIRLEDALSNLDGLSNTIKHMMTKNWDKIESERAKRKDADNISA